MAGERDVAALLRDVPVDPVEVADLIRRHWVLVLSDLTLPPTAPPVGVAALTSRPRPRNWPASRFG